MRTKKISAVMCMVFVLVVLFCVPVYASGDVAGAIEGTWQTASQQIKTVCRSCCISSHRSDPCRVLFLENWERHTLIIGNMGSLNGQHRQFCLPVWYLH